MIEQMEQYTKERFDAALGTAKTFMSNYEQLQFPIIDVENRLEFWNSEGYYMSLRTNKFDEKYKIAEASLKGGQASRNARKLYNLEQNEEKRSEYMYKAVRAKFAANTYLIDKLVATGDVEIIEKNSWKDTLFGVDDKNLVGKNVLGKVLMRIREEVKSNPKLI